MKQPIAGIAGLKPRAPRPKPDGHLSKQESRRLDHEYRVQRNETLRLKNHREAMLLAKSRNELILRDLVEKQAAYLLISMRQKMLSVPQAYAGRLVGLANEHEATQILRQAMIECLDELKNLPAKVTDASWIEHVGEKAGAGAPPESEPAKAKTRRRRAAG